LNIQSKTFSVAYMSEIPRVESELNATPTCISTIAYNNSSHLCVWHNKIQVLKLPISLYYTNIQ